MNNRAITITLKLDGSGDDDNNTENQTNTATKKDDKDGTAKAIASFAVVQSLQVVASEAVAWAEYYWNRELTLNDDYVGQRNKNIAISQINKGISVVSKIGTMAATGAMVGGPWGAVIGAVVGAGASALEMARTTKQTMEQQDIAIRQMDAQLSYTRQRAGWSLEAASIGEDL